MTYDNTDADSDGVIEADIDNDSVNTGQTVTGSLSADVSAASKPLDARKANVSLDDIFQTYTAIGDPYQDGNANEYPTIIHAASAFDNPLSDWYIYTSPYSTTEVKLFHTDDPESLPWTSYGTVLTAESGSSQADSPNVVYVPEANEVRMYYHEVGPGTTGVGSQHTLLATSPESEDGTSWTKQNGTFALPGLDGQRNGKWDDNERTYASVVRDGSGFKAVYMGRDLEANERGIGMAWSPDGKDWTTMRRPIAWGNLQPNWDPQTSLDIGGPSIFRLGGEIVITWNTDADHRALTWESAKTAKGPEDTVVLPDKMNMLSGDVASNGTEAYVVTKQEIATLDWGDYL